MSFFIGNQDKFLTNSSVHSINTRNKHNLRRPIALKYVEFHSKNKFEKLVHQVGFILRIYHDARSPERQIYISM